MISELELKEKLHKEETRVFLGWDFSYLDGRWESASLPWDYREIIDNYRKNTDKILDMGTGGGEFLLSLHHEPHQLFVTEGYKPNYLLCKERLEPLGVTVKYVKEDDALPYGEEEFDLVLNRHESFDVNEVRRIIKTGGYFITQQVGSENDRQLVTKLMGQIKKPFPDHDLVHSAVLLKEAGFEILEQKEEYPQMKFFDLGAAVYFAKQIPWEFPSFSVESCFARIKKLQQELREISYIENRTHRFLIVGRKL